MISDTANAPNKGMFAKVNGIEMYYEMYGTGFPMVLIHGGGSTIDTTFGSILPAIGRFCQVIAVELQAHGRSGDRNSAESFRQDADDVNELLHQLGIEKADIFGFSNGGQTGLEIAMRHGSKVRSLIVASAFYKRDGVPAGFWSGFKNPDFNHLPQVYKDEFLKVKPQPEALQNMFNKDAERMFNFQDWRDEELKKINCPVLIVIGDQDLPLPEHAVEMHRLLPASRLAILPGNHGSYMGEIMSRDIPSKIPAAFLAIMEDFIDSQTPQVA